MGGFTWQLIILNILTINKINLTLGGLYDAYTVFIINNNI